MSVVCPRCGAAAKRIGRDGLVGIWHCGQKGGVSECGAPPCELVFYTLPDYKGGGWYLTHEAALAAVKEEKDD